MTEGESPPDEFSSRRSKVQRLSEKYDLDGIGEELERLWTADGDDRMSLRDLADYFNQQLLTEAMIVANVQPHPDKVELTYEHLTGEAGKADQIQTRRQLEREDVNVDELLKDFLSYQTIRTYLKDYREVEYERADQSRIDAERKNIQSLRGRTKAVSKSKLDLLRKQNEINLGTFQTFVDISVHCEDCDRRFSVYELLDQGGCWCEGECE